jgi:hypothetical protein
MQHTLISDYFHIPEHKRIIAQPQFLAGGGDYIFQNNFLCYYIWIFFHVGIIGHLWVEIAKDGGSLVVRRMFGVVDTGNSGTNRAD